MSADSVRTSRRWLGLVALATALGCGGPSPPSAPTAAPALSRPPASALPLTSPLRSPLYDDSGFGAAGAYFLPIKDPRSLEHIRDCYQGAGYRGVEALRRQLAQGNPFPEQRLEMLQRIARLYLFEGEFRKASEILLEARALAEADPPRLGPALP